MLNDGRIYERGVMNLPGSIIDLPTLNERDEADIVEFGLKHGIDMVALSTKEKREGDWSHAELHY